MDYRSTLQDLFARSRGSGIRLGLQAIQQLLAALGNPERGLTCVVVAGTNGKGSTSVLLADALQRSGKSVGLFTSPHLLRFGERVRINGVPLADASLPPLMQRIQAAEAHCDRPATFFEASTAIALLAFSAAPVDIAVLEVGLGGRLDPTNVVQRDLAVITPIDFDHQEYLGNTLTAIAGEKADIIAAGRPVVVAPQPPEAMSLITRLAHERQAPLAQAAPMAALPAHIPPYQAINFGVATAAARSLGCPEPAIAAAVQNFNWPGRYQWIDGAPPLLLDGAHNPAGMAAFCSAIKADARLRGRPLHAVFSVVQGKDAGPMLQALRDANVHLHLCPVDSRRNRSSADLQSLAPDRPLYPSPAQALAAARAGAGPDGAVLVVGSLFLVADILAHVQNLPRDPAVDG